MKRNRRGVTSTSRSVVPQTEDDMPEWQTYLPEETLLQWNKLQQTDPHVQLMQESFADTLFASWNYQYVVAWLYKVCDSFATIGYGTATEDGSFKPMWKDIKFDEILLLNDLYDIQKSGFIREADSGDYFDESLYMMIRLQLLKQLSNNKGIHLKDWDTVVNHHLSNSEDTKFNYLSLIEQFEMLYRVIKIIETKSQVFINYLTNNLEMFQFDEYVLNDETSILALPNVGVLVQKKLVKIAKDVTLDVPIKLRNCTVDYRDEENNILEIVHLDLSNEIDTYLKSFKIEYEVLTQNWENFLEKFDQFSSNVDFTALIPTYTEHQLYTRRLLLQKEKEKSMAELLVRRKRSSRLVAREEETKRKDIESEWYEKLDEREHFIKTRNKLVIKQTKRLKDILWNQLWSKYEQDIKVEKLKRRNDELLEDENEYEGELNALDNAVIENGPRFKERIIDVPPHQTPPVNILELPEFLCITKEELHELANYGISTTSEQPDDKDWVFQCPGESDLPLLTISNIEDEEANAELFNKPIICCDMCLRWQHWECQNPQVIQLLTIALNKPIDQPLTQRDCAAVQLGGFSNRRSSRKQHNEPEYVRPIDKRKPIKESVTFLCAWCLSETENQLRQQFVPELKAIRLKQRKQLQDRERKRQLKEEKRQLQQQQQLLLLQNTNPVEPTVTAISTQPNHPSTTTSTTTAESLPLNLLPDLSNGWQRDSIN